ncbi:hypothetical protein SAMN02982927_02074 [Sporolactobacillus nakayamae]|uniref:Uncharacterized protein n=1 Tax=Sporolactobacillus nakayamae TaxID=269670 RepID=A0A1I2SXB1_9BACL|nr:hypothetical protein SAMN02982927_02074 [Sporolactobacillus nakayamae]
MLIKANNHPSVHPQSPVFTRNLTDHRRGSKNLNLSSTIHDSAIVINENVYQLAFVSLFKFRFMPLYEKNRLTEYYLVNIGLKGTG